MSYSGLTSVEYQADFIKPNKTMSCQDDWSNFNLQAQDAYLAPNYLIAKLLL